MYEGRERYPLAPLVFVTAELSLAYEPDVVTHVARDRFAGLVRGVLPVLRVEVLHSEPVSGPDGQEVSEKVPLLRALSEDERTTIALSVQSLTVATVAYTEYEEFEKLISLAVGALGEVAPRARIERAGLRYVDEYRVPGVGRSRDWAEWVSAPFVSAMDGVPADFEVDGFRCSMGIPRGDGRGVLFRWGEVEGSTVLNEDSSLRIERPPESRFFVVDIDSYWEPEVSQLATEAQLTEQFAQLHAPIGVMFTSTLTERIKELFRGERS